MPKTRNAQTAISRIEELAEALLAEVQILDRNQAVNDAATKVKARDVVAGIDFYDEVQKFEICLIKMALSETGGNQTKAARLLGLKDTTLHSKIKLFNVMPIKARNRQLRDK